MENTITTIQAQNPRGEIDDIIQIRINNKDSALKFTNIFPEIGQKYTLGLYLRRQPIGAYVLKVYTDSDFLYANEIYVDSRTSLDDNWQLSYITVDAMSQDMYWIFDKPMIFNVYEPRLTKGERLSDYSLNPYDTIDLESKYSQIVQTVDNISLEVGKKVGSDEIISKINLSPEEVQILADKISLLGYTTINGNFVVTEDGTIQAKDADVEITGGSISILTDKEYDDVINLRRNLSDGSQTSFIARPSYVGVERYLNGLLTSASLALDVDLIPSLKFMGTTSGLLLNHLQMIWASPSGEKTIYDFSEPVNSNGTLTASQTQAPLRTDVEQTLYKHQIGDKKYQVHLQACLELGTTGITIPSGGTVTLLNLPEDFRPPFNVRGEIFYNREVTKNANILLEIRSGGTVRVTNISSSSVTLNSVSDTLGYLYLSGTWVI